MFRSRNRTALMFAIVISMGLILVSTSINAAERQVIIADDNSLQKLSLVATATPQTAVDTKGITVSISMINRSDAQIRFPGTNVFLADTGLAVTSSAGTPVPPVRAMKRDLVLDIRFWYLAPGKAIGDTESLYDLGYDLSPGSYTLTVSHTGVADNVRSIHAAPIKVTISG